MSMIEELNNIIKNPTTAKSRDLTSASIQCGTKKPGCCVTASQKGVIS